MLAVDEGALRCDMLEYYHIFDYRALPARQLAVYACGLREDSRIMRQLSGSPAAINTVFLAGILDAVRILVWQNTKDGAEGRNQPESVLNTLLKRNTEQIGFASADEFEVWRNSIFEGDNNG